MAIVERRGVAPVWTHHHGRWKRIRAADAARRRSRQLLAARQVDDRAISLRGNECTGSDHKKTESKQANHDASALQNWRGDERNARGSRRSKLRPRLHPFYARVVGCSDSSSGCTLWRTSEPCTQKMTSSAILVA